VAKVFDSASIIDSIKKRPHEAGVFSLLSDYVFLLNSEGRLVSQATTTVGHQSQHP